MNILLSLFLSVSFSYAIDYPTIQLEDFQVGNFWVWAYFEKDKTTNSWNEPYLYEKYTVVKTENAVVTIEMSSAAKLPVNLPAHHKFLVNIETCLNRNKIMENLKPWTVEFYTKSFSPKWELVSQAHTNLVFTEKFNCVAYSNTSTEGIIPTQLGNVLVFKHSLPHWDSYYIKDKSDSIAVAALKHFDQYYKFELIQTIQ